MDPQQFIADFEKELKKRVDLRTGTKASPEKVLLECFKHYDVGKKEKADLKLFKRVMLVKLGISLFDEQYIDLAFKHYAQGESAIIYRNFIQNLYNVDVLVSARTGERSKFNIESMTNSKRDEANQESQVRKMIEFLIFKLRKGPLYTFARLYYTIKEYDRENRKVISLNEFMHCLKKNGLDVTPEEIKKIWMFFNYQGDGMEYERFVVCLCINFRDQRMSLIRTMFDRLDYMNTGKVSLTMLKELFNPKQHYNVKMGRETWDQVQSQLDDLIDVFVRINDNQLVVNSHSFISLFRLVSAYIENDLEFQQFIEHSFRYNEIPAQNNSVYSRNEPLSYNRGTGNDLASNYSELKQTNILDSIDEQLSKKGYMGYIKFYEILKANDYEHDQHLYLKHLEKALKEGRVYLTPKQMNKIYKEYSDDNVRMNYETFIQDLIPQFNDERTACIQDLYSRLYEGETEKHLTFQKLRSCFFVRGHPDFKTGVKHDYQLTQEFNSAIENFLICYQGNHMYITPKSFIRFFEFYGKNWGVDYLKSIVFNAFKTARKSQIQDNLSQHNQQSVVSKKSNIKSKYYEEFSQKVKQNNGPPPQQKQPVKQENPRRESQRSRKSISNRYKQAPPQPKPVQEPVKPQQSHLNDPNNVANIRRQLITNFKQVQSISLLLDVEYEMTEKSDDDGNVDVSQFASVLSNFSLLSKLDGNQISILYRQHMEDNGKLHVQTFCNEIRGQMDEEREELTVELFDRITPIELEELPLSLFKKSFNPKGYHFGKYKTDEEKIGMIHELCELVVCLNLSIKDKKELDLDDFLYMLDNFSFHYADTKDYANFLRSAFK